MTNGNEKQISPTRLGNCRATMDEVSGMFYPLGADGSFDVGNGENALARR
jgi:hypothetical protein